MWGKIRQEDGFTTMEVLVSLVIVSLLVIFSFNAVSQYNTLTEWNRQNLQATTMAYNKLESVRSTVLSSETLTTGVIMSGKEILDGVEYTYEVKTGISSKHPELVILESSVSWGYEGQHKNTAKEIVTLRST